MTPLRLYDDRKRELFFLRPPRRIVSLVPSDTLTLFALGAGDRVVGRTRYCVAPRGEVERVPAVGGTKGVDVEAVASLAPDLVVCNQEENARPQIEKLCQLGLPVLISFPKRVGEGLAHLARMARILDVEKEERVRELLRRGLAELRDAEHAASSRSPLRAFVPIWMKPLMTVNGDTFLSDALALAGAENVFRDRERKYPLAADLGEAEPRPPGERDTRYPRITLEEVEARAPEIMLLPDEPHPFSEEDAQVFRAQATPAAQNGKIVFCDGADLTWYGARSVEAIPRLRALVESLR